MPERAAKIGRATVPKETHCEIVRSFSYKLNTGNYQSVDFFCSQKLECPIENAQDISERLFDFVKAQVMRSVEQYKQDNMPQRIGERKAG